MLGIEHDIVVFSDFRNTRIYNKKDSNLNLSKLATGIDHIRTASPLNRRPFVTAAKRRIVFQNLC